MIISRTPWNSTRASILESFEDRVEFPGSSFKGLSIYFWPVLYHLFTSHCLINQTYLNPIASHFKAGCISSPNLIKLDYVTEFNLLQLSLGLVQLVMWGTFIHICTPTPYHDIFLEMSNGNFKKLELLMLLWCSPNFSVCIITQYTHAKEWTK